MSRGTRPRRCGGEKRGEEQINERGVVSYSGWRYATVASLQPSFLPSASPHDQACPIAGIHPNARALDSPHAAQTPWWGRSVTKVINIVCCCVGWIAARQAVVVNDGRGDEPVRELGRKGRGLLLTPPWACCLRYRRHRLG